MNNKLFSTGVSVALHVVFLVIAFNTIFVTPSVSAPVEPPMFIHVKIDSRPFSSSIGNNIPKTPTKPVITAPQTKLPKKEKIPMPKQQQLRPKKTVVRATKEQAVKPLMNAQEVFKDMAVSTRSVNASTVKPVSRIFNNQVQGMEGRANIESTMQNYQGVEPYLPFEHDGKAEDIKSFLGYDLSTYEDPEDHEKYFRLSVKVEDLPGSLPAIPKEIVFLIDTSNSIGADLLEKFNKGVQECLSQLGGSDKFNIVAFNNKIVRMQEQSVPNDVDNIQRATEFLNHLKANGSTDLYDTILKTIELNNPMKPAYIFLMSDGEPTQGVLDSQQIINQIAKVNKGRVALFGFGGGFVNKYFMNFVSFTNRGWSESSSFLQADRGVVDMYNHIKEPVLINLRYYATGLNEKEIYPKVLPDLFRGAEFVLYGHYNSQDKFLFQLRGDGETGLKQYIVDDNLSNGHPADRSIAQEWAMRKIYHLIGLFEYNQNNDALIEEVEALAKKFDLKIPQYKK
jgi:uncharacterized protein YegL